MASFTLLRNSEYFTWCQNLGQRRDHYLELSLLNSYPAENVTPQLNVFIVMAKCHGSICPRLPLQQPKAPPLVSLTSSAGSSSNQSTNLTSSCSSQPNLNPDAASFTTSTPNIPMSTSTHVCADKLVFL